MAQSFVERLQAAQQSKNSRLCIGLDPDPKKMPDSFACSGKDGIFRFIREIVDQTHLFACTYKPNAAFWAARAAENELAEIIRHIHHEFSLPAIFDGKRNDIGATAELYAQEVFGRFEADAVTTNPYLGIDCIRPFAEFDNGSRGVIVLCRTSNKSAPDFQGSGIPSPTGTPPLYIQVARKAKEWQEEFGNIALVLGATFPEELAAVRDIVGPEMLVLAPGIGKQGGDLEAVMKANKQGLIVVNSSSGIIHASSNQDSFADDAAEAAETLRDQINAAFSPQEVVTS